MAGSFQAADAALNAFFPGNPPGVRQAAVSLGLRRIVQRLTADVSVSSNTVLAPVTGLSFNVEAGRTYRFRYELSADNAGAAQGIKFDLAGGNATVSFIEGTAIIVSALAVTRLTALNTSAGNNSTGGAIIFGTLTASNTGTVTLQFAQNTSGATASVLRAGSAVEVEDITT